MSSLYRQLLRLARKVEVDAGTKAFLVASHILPQAVVPPTVPLHYYISQIARNPNIQHVPNVTQLALAELRLTLARPALYAQRHAALQANGIRQLTPNQLWYEGRVQDLGDDQALRLLQEAIDAGVTPTQPMYTAATSQAAKSGQWSTVLQLLRHMEAASPWLPDSVMASRVISALLHTRGVQTAVNGAQALQRWGILPEPALLTELVSAAEELLQNQGITESSDNAVLNPFSSRLLTSLGEALVPKLQLPITNLEALERYIRLCRQCGAVKEANRVQSYIFAHEQYALEEADGDLVVGLPTD